MCVWRSCGTVKSTFRLLAHISKSYTFLRLTKTFSAEVPLNRSLTKLNKRIIKTPLLFVALQLMCHMRTPSSFIVFQIGCPLKKTTQAPATSFSCHHYSTLLSGSPYPETCLRRPSKTRLIQRGYNPKSDSTRADPPDHFPVPYTLRLFSISESSELRIHSGIA